MRVIDLLAFSEGDCASRAGCPRVISGELFMGKELRK